MTALLVTPERCRTIIRVVSVDPNSASSDLVTVEQGKVDSSVTE